MLFGVFFLILYMNLFNFLHVDFVLLCSVCMNFIGTCTCGAGFTGDSCDRHCDFDFFGHNCQQVCQCSEDNSNGCNPITGRCLCKSPWKGIVVFLTHVCANKFKKN